MFVPCEKFIYYPFTSLFARIPSGDNLKKGHSTFTAEVEELKGIISESDANTLVVGDELCSGTESVSALAIVRTGLLTLYNKNTSFVFATHIHDLTASQRIKDLKSLKIFHLSTRKENGEIIFDRKLKEGQGDTIYGLEICQALGMPKDFMELAFDLREEILGEKAHPISFVPCKYNKEVYLGECICNNKATEEHHILHQANADSSGHINHMHKNHPANLISTCQGCHDRIHAGEIKVSKIQTSQGVKTLVLDSTKQPISTYQNIVVSPHQLVFEMKAKGFTQKKICAELGISLYRLKRILAGMK